MSIEKDRDRLSQTKMLAWLKRDPPLTEMLTVYLSDREYPSNNGIYCALVPRNCVKRVLAHPAWDLQHEGGVPSSITHIEEGRERVEYLRFGNSNGVEPLIIERNFHGYREDYLEISEEFRLFHKLYHDRKADKFFKIDENGREHLVAVITPDRAKIRLKEIRQFLAIKGMYLSIQFECKEFSKHSLAELGFERGRSEQRDSLLYWKLHYEDTPGNDEYRAHSYLHGKRLFSPLPKSKSGFPGFAETSESV